MKTCIYCGSKVELLSGEIYKCSFCEVNLGPNSPYGEVGIDGTRPKIDGFKTGVVLRDEDYLAELSVKELMINSMTLSMMYSILKEMRLIRSEAYLLLKEAKDFLKLNNDKLPLDQINQFEHSIKSQGETYEFWTRKMWMVENVCIKKFGYCPAAIQERSLDQMENTTIKVSKKTMKINSTINSNISVSRETVAT
ncbi:hypothetical protein QK289_13300 [Exiguobacterium antarcticum]|uniref:Uncharacterized protein n=1 Tax=Exiguobacterium antarcticum TaxID=132920 RepID=A0ABT6R4W1_9BACL|nr:hypothetical protein [Exiguobacterium antarcticum]MDI3235987.1 hypothetical protein [Exiguobacterium antarcticum]